MEKIDYDIDIQALSGQWVSASRFDFETTIIRLKAAIEHQELWLIHEIDPKMLMKRYDLNIAPARQLLFFHPRFLRRILENNPSAILEVPLKIIIMSGWDGRVILRGPNIQLIFERYPELTNVREELVSIYDQIVDSVALNLDPSKKKS